MEWRWSKKLDITPLIKLNILLNGILEVPAVYDSGSNISIINTKLLCFEEEDNSKFKTGLKTVNGVRKLNGMVRLKIKIFEIEEEVDVLVLENENYEHNFLIGLDCIKKFKLRQDEDLKITQKIKKIPGYAGNQNKKTKEKVFEINFNEHIKLEDFQVKINHLDSSKRYKINKLINNYSKIFAKDKYDVGMVREYEARIDLAVDKYCSKRPYRCTIEDKKEIEKQISKLLEKT